MAEDTKGKSEEQAELSEAEESAESDETQEPKAEVLESTWTLTSIQKADLPNLWQRMVIARQHMQYIKKTRQGGLKFATLNHDEVTSAAREALDKANVLAIPNVLMHDKTGNTTICEVEVEFVNPDVPEERYSVTMFGESNDNQDKGPGGATSYALKYCLIKALMGETGEKDADEQDVDTETPQPATPKKDPDERQELFDQLKELMGMYDLDTAYVRNEMGRRTGGKPQTAENIRDVIKNIGEHPELWRDPDTQGK